MPKSKTGNVKKLGGCLKRVGCFFNILSVVIVAAAVGCGLYFRPDLRKSVREKAVSLFSFNKKAPVKAEPAPPLPQPEEKPVYQPEPEVKPPPAVSAVKDRREPASTGGGAVAAAPEKPPYRKTFSAFPESRYPARGQKVLPYNRKLEHLALGIPGRGDVMVYRSGYAFGFSKVHNQPEWVQYRHTRERAMTKAAAREEVFRKDPAISGGTVSFDDYHLSGYDCVQMAPASDLGYSAKTRRESFFMGNVSPQKPEFHRGIWKSLEVQIRSFAIEEYEIYVVSGPVLPAKQHRTIGTSRITVPEYFYKVVYAPAKLDKPAKMIGFILRNAGSKRPLKSFAVTVDMVESVTGLNFFSALPRHEQEELESTLRIDDWKWN